jgi:hypothetical protein
MIPWTKPVLISLNVSAINNNISGIGDIDSTYSGFPYGYS